MRTVAVIVAMAVTSALASERGGPGPEAPTKRPARTPQARNSLQLADIPFRIVYETYRETDGKGNWELYTINADGSGMTNLTNTPDIDEMYPQVSPDGTKLCFVVDEGRGRRRVRHIYYMNIDGTQRVHVAAHARQPCWCFDSKSIAYCNDEYKRYSTREYATSGVTLYYLDTGWERPHRNAELHHLYAITWGPHGKWFLGVVHGGMGYSDTILAFEAFGTGVFDMARWGVKGCRPNLSVDGTRMVWGETDWNLCLADIDLTGVQPVVTNLREIIRCERKYKVYHVDISPDSKHIVFTYGPFAGGQQVGGAAEGWNLCVGDLNGTWVQITTDGLHNKEPDWIPMLETKP
jgi:hypothetical protein